LQFLSLRSVPFSSVSFLGFSPKLSTTLEIYTVPIPAHQRAAVENLARLVINGDELEQCGGKLPETTQQIQ